MNRGAPRQLDFTFLHPTQRTEWNEKSVVHSYPRNRAPPHTHCRPNETFQPKVLDRHFWQSFRDTTTKSGFMIHIPLPYQALTSSIIPDRSTAGLVTYLRPRTQPSCFLEPPPIERRNLFLYLTITIHQCLHLYSIKFFHFWNPIFSSRDMIEPGKRNWSLCVIRISKTIDKSQRLCFGKKEPIIHSVLDIVIYIPNANFCDITLSLSVILLLRISLSTISPVPHLIVDTKPQLSYHIYVAKFT